MKKSKLTVLCMLCITLLQAQNVDSVLQNKYWSYKDRFLKHFTNIGKDDGESLPLAIIQEVHCGDIHGKKIGAGDLMVEMGPYLGVLATEYHLLKQKGQDLLH